MGLFSYITVFPYTGLCNTEPNSYQIKYLRFLFDSYTAYQLDGNRFENI